MKWAQQFEKASGPCGLFVITETGLCLDGDVAGIEAGCTKRYELVAIPNASGAVLKSLDGTSPIITQITLPTSTAKTYSCVKVQAFVNPFAPVQNGGNFEGNAVLLYTITWQQVGGAA